LPLTIGGKAVLGRNGDGVVGEALVPHSDDAVAVFRRGQYQQVRDWLEGYGWGKAPGFETAMRNIKSALAARR
jgi:hypothetical protein